MNIMKPVLFCDFDGVINQFPYTYMRETDGSHVLAVEYGGHTNYGFLKSFYNEELFFPSDEFFLLDTVKGTFPINYSNEMVDRLRKLIVEDKVEFIWLTTWRDEAVRLLNPLFGFPEHVGFLPWQQKMSDYNHAGKGHAAMDYFEDNPSFRDRGMIWLDDVATRRLETWHEDSGFVENEAAERLGFPKDKLIMLTDESFGITRAGMDAIEEFVG